jgi:hypothetical protein
VDGEDEAIASTDLEHHNPQPPRIIPRGFSVDDVTRMAESVARSGLFPGVSNPASAFSLMMLCQSEGLHPMQALKRYHIIEGRPTMRADAIQAEFQRSGGRIQWLRYDREEARAIFSHPQHAPDGVELAVTFDEFHKTGMVTGKYGLKDNWKHHPDSMLRARLISKGVRMVHPGIVSGVYTPEEASDFGGAEMVLPPPAPRGPHPNESGYKTGKYASPQQIAAYLKAVSEFCVDRNAEWLDSWCTPSGELAEGVRDLLHPIQVTRHHLKWAAATGRLSDIGLTVDPETGKLTEKTSSEQDKALVAVVFAREPEAVAAEAWAYYEQEATKERERIKKKIVASEGGGE